MSLLTRRGLIVAGTASLILPRRLIAANALRLPTPAQTEGPFYPDVMPTDQDGDLVRIAELLRDAGGEILSLSGRVIDIDGRPVEGAIVEIWQCDVTGHYIHTGDTQPGEHDRYFQGFGRALASADGTYRFRTIRPVPYPGRTPHIHFKVYRPTGPALTTQMYVAAEAERNARDVLYRRLSAPEQAALTVELLPAASGGWEGAFDLVLPV